MTIIRHLFAFACVTCFLLCATVLMAQGSKMRSEYESVDDRDADHPQAREQWFLRGRILPGERAATLRYRAHLQKMQMRAMRQMRLQQEGVRPANAAGWVPLGPAPLASDASGFGQQDYGWVSGRATAVAVDPSDQTGNTVYVGGAYGGLWKSTNAGPASLDSADVTWTPLLDGEATLAVGAIAIQPANSSVILVGTGETNSSADSYYGLGILRSTSAGASWTLIPQSSDLPNPRPFAGLGFSKIAFSTVNPSLAVAAAAGTTLGDWTGLEDPVNTNRGLYYSTDGGATWLYASVKDNGVTVDPGSATSVIFNANAGSGTFFAAMRNHGVYSSTDGAHWTRLATQPGSALSVSACPPHVPQSGSTCPIYRGEFAVVPGRNEMYFWFVDSSEADRFIWKTVDGGAHWAQINESGINNCGDAYGCGASPQAIYNLTLGAVPNGSATDLYAGAINLFKCTITSSLPSCNGSGPNTFLNLTHVYGCSSIAKVHPDQHGLGFLLVNGKDVMYFANDGGLYRTLDGFTNLNTGSCGGFNQFDSLNQTLGSMAQFVSFSQHPSDQATLLGGTQDNGSPATTSAETSTVWANVNGGDGGYSAIDPQAPNDWFVTNPDVPPAGLEIEHCSQGINCHTQDFAAGAVATSANLGNDDGAFYFPFLLDPQAVSQLIIGTCRVWRGSWQGGSYSLLSPNFEVGGSAACNGHEVNLVRSLAAGGPKDASGYSNVLYAGTDGYGPLMPTTPTGGQLWITVNAAGGSSSWANRTANTNPGAFPISNIAIDASDTSGNTAYVVIMGFHVAHVWKTSDAGQSWSDFTGAGGGSLPDAPADAVVVDPGADSNSGTVYVATDVGVFSSPTSAPSWTEVGPAPGSPGFLPNVAVTALRLFNSGGQKILRASTYGRGLWEFGIATTPDFRFSVPNATQTVFATQTAVFSGKVIALNGYNSTVTLSCSGNAPSACTPNPGALVPTNTGTSFTVSAAGAVGDYAFNVHGVGNDSNTTTHDAPLTLHVVDFGITPPNPGTVNANIPNPSQPTSFQVTAAGAFSGVVTLSCGGLPSGAACNFSPSDSVSPTSSAPVNVTLVIGTSSSTPTGTFPLTISANATGAPAPKTQNLTLQVTALADYTISISNPSLSAGVTSQAVFNGTLTAYNGYASPVNLGCGNGAPATCNAAPTSVIPTTGGVAFTVTVSSEAVHSFAFNITAQGTDPKPISHAAAVVFHSTFDFAITNTSPPQIVNTGLPATYNLDVAPDGSGNTFPGSVSLSCTGLPDHAGCSFSPAQVSAGAGDTPVTLTINTGGAAMARRSWKQTLLPALWLPLPALLLFGRRRRLRLSKPHLWMVLALTFAAGLTVSCGGGGDNSGGSPQPGSTPGIYDITVTAKVNTGGGVISHSTVAQLTVH